MEPYKKDKQQVNMNTTMRHVLPDKETINKTSIYNHPSQAASAAFLINLLATH
jgi:hypothetical protein